MGNNEPMKNKNRFTAAQERIDQLVDLQRLCWGFYPDGGGWKPKHQQVFIPTMGWLSVSVFPTLTLLGLVVFNPKNPIFLGGKTFMFLTLGFFGGSKGS